MTWTIRSIGDAEQNDYEGYTGAGTVPYYLDSTIDYVKYLVCQTSRFVSVAGRNISTDRLYTSLPITIFETCEPGRFQFMLFESFISRRLVETHACHALYVPRPVCDLYLLSYTTTETIPGGPGKLSHS